MPPYAAGCGRGHLRSDGCRCGTGPGHLLTRQPARNGLETAYRPVQARGVAPGSASKAKARSTVSCTSSWMLWGRW
jgi:hypothetical protein